MKHLFLMLILVNLFVLNFYGQELLISKADSLRNLGNSFIDRNPEKCISLLDSAANLYSQLNNKIQQAYCLQNIAFTYDEKLGNIDKAISYIEKTIPIWISIQKPLNQANLLKYLGMLQGKKGKYTKGAETIRKAISLFYNNNFEDGIAVSYFDLALLYDNAFQVDSSIFYFEKNKAYFETKHDTLRIFLVNNKLFESNLKIQNFDIAFKFYEYNLNLEKSSHIHWQHLIDYYRISMEYYKLVDNSELYDYNQEKYKQLSKKLKEQGIVVR